MSRLFTVKVIGPNVWTVIVPRRGEVGRITGDGPLFTLIMLDGLLSACPSFAAASKEAYQHWKRVEERYAARVAYVTPKEEPSITCPRCGLRSYHPKDIAEKFCAACDRFHDE